VRYLVKAANLRAEFEVHAQSPVEAREEAKEQLRANSISTRFASLSVREVPDEEEA